MTTTTTQKIKDLATLKELYNEEKQIIAVTNDFNFTVIMKGREYTTERKPDCKISSFKANLFFRTQKGINKESYKNTSTLQTAIKKEIKKVTLLEVRGFILNNRIDII